MLLNAPDPTTAQPGAESSQLTSPQSDALLHISARPAGYLDRVPETEDSTSLRSAAEDWAAESGMAVSEFQRAYFEECVTDLMDQYPALRRTDAERLALREASWLEDRAA